MSKSVVRSLKNVSKGYSHVQVKVRNATSNDAWGPSGTEMSEIAQMTFNSSGDFYEIMDMLDKRLNDKGKNWRHVLKSLKVLDYCLHEGSELVVTWARKNIYIIKTLREFQYVDEDGRDVGLNVRTSAKELTSLILDEDRLRAERHDRKLWKSRVTGLDEFAPPPGIAGVPEPPKRRERRANGGDENDDLEYKLALEASKNQMEEDRKRQSHRLAPEDDDDLAKAIRLSQEEEALRRRELEEQNASSLFDDTPAQQPQATGFNQGYQQQGAVDWFGNLVDQQPQQQPQSTGYLNNSYAQPQGMQAQQTGFQNGYGYNSFQQPQQTGFDQAQYQQPQATYMQPQQTAYMNNPYGDQSQLQQQPTAQPGSHNPWATGADTQDSLKPQPTGSNNPFASSFNRPQPQTSTPKRALTLNTLQEQKTSTQFSQPYSQPATAFPPQHTVQPQREANPHHANLNALLASGEGQDTFGNVGNMRIPAQHTAPGTFVNSSGSGLNRLQVNQTGTNPFLHAQQTGQFAGMQQQPAQMYPAQTGPAGGFGAPGYGSPNPFGAQHGQQGQQHQGNSLGGSLIDL